MKSERRKKVCHLKAERRGGKISNRLNERKNRSCVCICLSMFRPRMQIFVFLIEFSFFAVLHHFKPSGKGGFYLSREEKSSLKETKNAEKSDKDYSRGSWIVSSGEIIKLLFSSPARFLKPFQCFICGHHRKKTFLISWRSLTWLNKL